MELFLPNFQAHICSKLDIDLPRIYFRQRSIYGFAIRGASCLRKRDAAFGMSGKLEWLISVDLRKVQKQISLKMNSNLVGEV